MTILVTILFLCSPQVQARKGESSNCKSAPCGGFRTPLAAPRGKIANFDPYHASLPFKEITKITLEAAQAIELDTGVVLPPGSYSGARMRTRDDLPGGVIWTPTRYRIELTAEQIASMGAKVQPNQSFEEIDVTKFVSRGRLIIR